MQEERIAATLEFIQQKAAEGYTGKIEVNMNDGGITNVKGHKTVDLDCIIEEPEEADLKNGKTV